KWSEFKPKRIKLTFAKIQKTSTHAKEPQPCAIQKQGYLLFVARHHNMAVESVRRLACAGGCSSNKHDGGANDMTNVTSDIEHWYDMNEPENQEDKNDLTRSVETVATV